jgi:hypothetical protein
MFFTPMPPPLPIAWLLADGFSLTHAIFRLRRLAAFHSFRHCSLFSAFFFSLALRRYAFAAIIAFIFAMLPLLPLPLLPLADLPFRHY